MVFFQNTRPNDPEGQFAALRRMIAEARNITLVDALDRRTQMIAQAEAIFGAATGPETSAFLELLADILASDAFEVLCGEAGKVHIGDPCPYIPGLIDVSTLDPTLSGLSFMHTDKPESHFVISASEQAERRCGVRVFERRKHMGQVELRSAQHSDATLLCFALRLWGRTAGVSGLSFGTEARDQEAFAREAATCFGPPANLGNGVYLYELAAGQILVTPSCLIPIELQIWDTANLGPISEDLLEQMHLSRDEVARSGS